MRISISICFLLLLLSGSEGHSQPSNLYFHHVDKNSGIPQSVCNDIFRDSRGYTWVTTISGLYRYDGMQFIDVLKGNEQLKSHALKDIEEDKDGILWLTKNDDQLVRYDPYSNKAEIISLRSFLQPYHVAVMGLHFFHLDEYNRLWIGINGNGIACFDIKTRQLKMVLQPDLGRVFVFPYFSKRSLLQSVVYKKTWQSDTVYRGSFDSSLNVKWVVKKAPTITCAEFGYATDADNIWYADSNCIVQYNWLANTVSRFPLFNKATSYALSKRILPDDRQRLWVSFGAGLACFDAGLKKVTQTYWHDPSDPFSIKDGCIPVLYDEEDNLWGIKFGDGISFCNLSSFRLTHWLNKSVAEKNGISNFIRALITGNNGSLYASCEGTGIVEIDSSGSQKVLVREQGVSFETIYRDRSGKIWMGAQQLLLYDPNVKTIVEPVSTKELNGQRIASLLQLRNGNILIGTYTNLFLYRSDIKKTVVLEGIREKQQIFSFLYEMQNGDLLVGQRDKGIKRYRPSANGYILHQDVHHNLFVKACLQTAADELWFATTIGLHLYKISSGVLQPLTTINQKLPDLYLYGLMQDANGYYWVSSNAGLFRWKGNACKSFGSMEGIQSSEFNTNAFCKSGDGTLYFGGVNGINKIGSETPEKFYSFETHLQLLQVMAGDTSFLKPAYGAYTQVKIAPGNSIIEVEYNTINLFEPGKYKVEYRLRNYNDRWQTATATGVARFVNLKPGNYIFEIRLYNPDDLQRKEIHSLPLYLVPFWWQTTLFKIAAVVVLLGVIIGVIFFFFRYRLKQERMIIEKELAIQKERERIVSDLHDDIGATLSSMNIYGDLAGNIWDSKPEESKKLVEKISGTSKGLMERMGDIIWSMKPADEEKYTLAARLKNYSTELLAPKNIMCEFDIDEKLVAAIAEPEKRKNILLIVKEALNNIVKYSDATKAIVGLKVVDQYALLLITDNGRGFILSERQHGNGLQNIEQRCKNLGGNCMIETAPGEGVKVRCIFPMAIFRHYQ